jgi:hypothetical protein
LVGLVGFDGWVTGGAVDGRAAEWADEPAAAA